MGVLAIIGIVIGIVVGLISLVTSIVKGANAIRADNSEGAKPRRFAAFRRVMRCSIRNRRNASQ